MNLCKYYKQKEIVSYDEGETWQDVIPYVYQVGELYEIDSPDCTSGEPVIRWRLVPGDFLCEDNNKYEKEIEEYTVDGTVWRAVFPTTYRKGRLLETDAIICHNKWEGHYYPNQNDRGNCPMWHNWVDGVGCVYVDPIKFVRCATSTSTTLTRSEVLYPPYSLYYGTIGDCVINTGVGTFSGMTTLSSITISDGVIFLDDKTFSGCTHLASIDIPDSVLYINVGVFENCSSLTSATIGNSVITIGYGAFRYCSGLTSIDIPDSTTSIGDYAFYECSGVTSCTLGSSVTTIGNSAFRHVRNLPNINIPDSVTSIGTSAFTNCHDLQSIVIPSGVTSIQNGTFYQCRSLSSVTIGNGVTTIGDYSFYNCDSLSSITIPNSVTTIGNNAFWRCYSLSSITIPNSVTTIGEVAFCDCRSLSSVTIPNSVTSIGQSAFQWDSGLTEVSIGSGVTSIGDTAFYLCTNLSSVTFNSITPPTLGNNVFEATQIASGNGVIYVPCDSFADYITASGFSRYARQIRGIPPCEISIKYKATYVDLSTYETYCLGSSNSISTADTRPTGYAVTAMTSADFDEDCAVQHIMNGAFSGCTSLSSVTIPDSVGWIWDSAFENCNHLTSIDIPDSVTNVRGSAFKYCSRLTSVHIGSGVTYIGQDAFRYCSNLTGITIDAETPPSLSSSGGVFDNTNNCPIYVPCGYGNTYKSTSGWTTYSSRIVENGCPELQITAYYNNGRSASAVCDSSTELTRSVVANLGLPSSYFTGMTRAIIGGCITSIGSNAFANQTYSTSLSSVTIPDSVITIGSKAFENCSGITSINIPSGVTTIGDKAFNGCKKITGSIETTMVTTIGEASFQNCVKLTNIYIGNRVTNIGNFAFYGCSGLTGITINATTPPTLGNLVFDSTNNCPIYVPYSSVNTYKSASRWSNYASRIQAIP